MSYETSIKTDIEQAPITKDFIKQFLPDTPIVLEAGAHIGRDTLKMSLLWPNGKIYAFEPVPELFEQLKQKAQERHNIFVYPFALSTSNGTAVLYTSSGASTAASSLLKPKEYSIARPEVQFSPQIVQTITLNSWAQEHTITHIDFMWLDMQGHELAVLQASPEFLKTTHALLIEVSITERFENNPLYHELRTWVETQGFKAVRQDLPKHGKINIFFIKNIRKQDRV